MLAEYFWRHLVAGRPVVNIRQEYVDTVNTAFEVPVQRKNERVQLILFEVSVGQSLHECLRLAQPDQFFSYAAAGVSLTDNGIRIDSWNQPCLKLLILAVLCNE